MNVAERILVTRPSMPDFQEYVEEIRDIWESRWLTNMGAKHQLLEKQLGTFLGVVLGNVLPLRVVSALSVSLFGMFIAIFIPPARKDKVVAGLVALSFLTSWAFSRLGPFASLSSGLRTIILTVALSLGAALLFPVKEKEGETDA